MANLIFVPIRAHPGGTLNYITRKDAIISEQSHDVYNVLNYMGEPKSVERIYVYSRHCSQNPKLAEKEIKLHQQMYYQSKQGAKPRQSELLGLHFIQSYTEEDNPSVTTMSEIMQALVEHPLLKDYATLGSHHFDKSHKHSHWYTSQFSAVGKPRKMGLQKEDIYELMRFSNKLCVAHGLSVIDNTELRKDPEYNAWIDSVIGSGTVVVHKEKNIKRTRSKKKEPIKNHYYRWMKKNEERAEDAYQLMTDTQRKKKHFEEKYFYTPDGDEAKRWYVTGDQQHRFYTVSRTSPDGYLRSMLELTIRFIFFVATEEGKYIRQNDPEIWLKYNAKVDTNIQNMYNCISAARRMNISGADQIADRIADVGKQMNVLRAEKARHEKSIEKQEEIIAAYETYMRVKPLVEGVDTPVQEAVAKYKAAYALLAQNQIFSAEAYRELCLRRDFEKQKTVDYAKRMPELNKQYHDLKRLEALTANPIGMLREIYGYSLMAYDKANSSELERRIQNATSRAGDRSSTGIEKEK